MSITNIIRQAAAEAIRVVYAVDTTPGNVQVNVTKPDFEGDYTIVLFGLIKQLKQSPDNIGNDIGNYLVKNTPLFTGFNIVKGFLNLTIADKYWTSFLHNNHAEESFGLQPANNETVVVEYSSPNTNKPLHLGHLRNNFLGWSIAAILKATGNHVVKTCIVNDRGIHICKSMIAWQRFANGATPETTGQKGDHFVGDYYVRFNDAYKEEANTLMATGMTKEMAEKEAPIMKAAQQMLLEWEAGNPEVLELWHTMNGWVYSGFETTYSRIGSDFDTTYYESETYLLGKEMIEEGLQKNVFYKKDDGSVWIDLTADGLDEKIVRRKDGTSVYITQDIGLAAEKYKEYKYDQSIYVIGDEQNYHMKVLKLICRKLELASAEGIHHLSYGMVELPTGKMKSREGTVVDADDLLDEMNAIARQKTIELGKVKDFTDDELEDLYNVIGLGALKFFLLRVDPVKRMVFNPEESIDFHGFTGPFIQYTHARIKSVLRKLQEAEPAVASGAGEGLLPLEKGVIFLLEQFPSVIVESAAEHDPSKLAVYTFNLAKAYNTFYTAHSVANAETPAKKVLRSQLSQLTAQVIKTAMGLLGIRVPERM